jgi:hypothetical protein
MHNACHEINLCHRRVQLVECRRFDRVKAVHRNDCTPVRGWQTGS